MNTGNRLILVALIATLLANQSFGQQLRGVNYGIQRSDGSCASYQQVLADFQIIKEFAQAVKIFQAGYCNGATNVIQAAKATGLKVFLGVQAAPDGDFNNEKNALRNAFNAQGFSNVLGITVGSEDLYRGSVSSDSLAAKITDVKALVRSLGSSVPVTHTDVYYLQPQNIIDASDIVMFNAFPFWEGVTIANAKNTMIDHYNSVKAKAGGKTVWIGETGWPTEGGNQGAAVPNSDNMKKYLNDFICWANANGVPYFWFEAFDEPWKGAGVESHWGLYTKDRVKKAGFALTCAGSATSASTSAAASSTRAPTSAVASTSASAPKTSTSASTARTSAVASSATPGTSATCTRGSCGTNQCSCNGQCYSPSQYVCVQDNKGATVLCPTGTLACNSACYDPKLYTCGTNGLQPKPRV
eukprot:TRINITY_DN4487_c0_g1_i2.p1 TRINITY_DN4487_c0_g1~~TRINITY_DN4487_c0_g1_i2.p1  ORF type:complete len:413 (-),score=105.05 TRINITY_DN4487_c0_g1_i2:39-1277(-)